MSHSLVIISAFELEQKLSYFVLSSLPIFLNTKTSVVTNLKFLIESIIKNNLIADSASLSCGSGLKEFKFQHYKYLQNL